MSRFHLRARCNFVWWTSAFFLSFLPQFVSPHLGHVVGQFLLLGFVSVALNTLADLIVVTFAAPLGGLLRSNPKFRRNQRVASGIGMIGLGAFVAFGERTDSRCCARSAA